MKITTQTVQENGAAVVVFSLPDVEPLRLAVADYKSGADMKKAALEWAKPYGGTL